MTKMQRLISTAPHYRAETGHEAIDVILQYGLTFPLGNTVKYISRAGCKEGNTAHGDLTKAMAYIDYEIHDLIMATEREGDSDEAPSLDELNAVLKPFDKTVRNRSDFDEFFCRNANKISLAWGLEELKSKALIFTLRAGVFRRVGEYMRAVVTLEYALDELHLAAKQEVSDG